MNVEQLRARHRSDIVCRSGLQVTVDLPNMLDCLIAANVPVPVIEHIQAISAASNGDTPEPLALSELGEVRKANKEMIRRAVIAIDGEVLTEPFVIEDVEAFTEEEQADILDHLNRKRTDPKAGSLT